MTTGLSITEIKRLAANCRSKKRLCTVALSPEHPEVLTKCQIIGIGRHDVSVKRVDDGQRLCVKPEQVQEVE